LAQQRRVTELHKLWREWCSEVGNAMAFLVKASEERGAAGAANGRGAEVVGESDAPRSQSIYVWSAQDGVPGTAHQIGSLIVGEDKKQIRPLSQSGEPC
jgi:hypothetical protein